MIGYDVAELRDNMSQLIGTLKPNRELPVLVAFQCNYHAGVNGSQLPENIRPIRVHCTSRIDILDLLKVFECGADGAYVILCQEDNCKYQGITPRVRKRLEYTKQLLEEVGIDSKRLGCFDAGPQPEEVWRQAAEEMTEKVKALEPRKAEGKR